MGMSKQIRSLNLDQEDWELLGELLRCGRLGPRCCENRLQGLARAGLVARLAPSQAAVVTGWGELRWRQEARRRRRAALQGG